MIPTWKDQKIVAVDIETCDPTLKKYGPGVRGDGRIVGIALAIPDAEPVYLPVDHKEGPNLPKEQVYAYLSELLSGDCLIVGANLTYDIDYLLQAGVNVTGPYYDIQLAEPLLDESAKSYSLDAIAKKYLGIGKQEAKLEEWVVENLGKRASVKANIWQAPASVVEEYAKYDAKLPLLIKDYQLSHLQEQGLMPLFQLESKLQEMVLAMTRYGVRIDVFEKMQVEGTLNERIERDQKALDKLAGRQVNVFANRSIAAACDKLGVEYSRTAKGAPSFTKAFMDNHPHPLIRLVQAVRTWNRYQNTFVEAMGNYIYDGRIHAQFNQLKSDRYGTETGRFSSSNPNLQQIPSRDAELGPMVRGMFVPEIDHTWAKIDYSAVEPRIAIHYSDDKDVKAALWANPEADVYQPLLDALPEFKRSTLKAIWLGISYGMGKQKLADSLGLSLEEATKVRQDFSDGVPFLSELYYGAMEEATEFGYVRTLLNRRRRFNMWESATKFGTEPVSSREKAVELYKGPNKRAYTYKAFNSVIQGSSADIIKKAMVDLWESGIFNDIPVPHLTVHDELDFSIPIGKEKQYLPEIKHMMENAVKLTVPLHVSIDTGNSWGRVSEWKS